MMAATVTTAVAIPPSTATARSSSPTVPRSSTFGPSFSPAPDLKSNPHPYAIKTTSTGILSRSSSTSSHSIAGRDARSGISTSARHNYVPASTKSSGDNQSNSKRKGEYRGHRYSRSLSSDTPISFPQPGPSPSLPQEPPLRLKRSETLPPSASAPSSLITSPIYATPIPTSADPLAEELPSNPKAWTPTNLSTYLSTALRVTGKGDLPAPVATDIASFIKSKRITGRVFLRFNDADLEAMGMNKLWREALLSASRALRQNVVRGRIWGFEAGTGDLGSPLSSSDDDLRLSPTTSDSSSIKSLEVDAQSQSGFDSLRGYPHLADEEEEENMTPSRRQARRSTNRLRKINAGRVKGMIDTYERTRSGSESDASGASTSASESEGGENEEAARMRKRKRKVLPVILSPSIIKEESSVRHAPTKDASIPPSLSSFFVPPSPINASYGDGDDVSTKRDDNELSKASPKKKEISFILATNTSQEPMHSYLPGTPMPIDESCGPPPMLFDSTTILDIEDEEEAMESPQKVSYDTVKDDTSSITVPAPFADKAEGSEPTIEELLSQHEPSSTSSSVPRTGARAWEDDFSLGETVKRAPSSPTPNSFPDTGRVAPPPPDMSTSSSSVLSVLSPPPPYSPFKKSPAKADSQKSLSRFTGARAWEAEVELDNGHGVDHGRSGSGSGGRNNRKVTVKKIGDVFGRTSTDPAACIVDEKQNSPPFPLARQDSSVQTEAEPQPVIAEQEDASHERLRTLQQEEEQQEEERQVRDREVLEAQKAAEVQAELERQMALERQLEEDIGGTRQLAEAMKARLEDVERKVVELEAEDKRKKLAWAESRASTSSSSKPDNGTVASPGSFNSKILSLLQRYITPFQDNGTSSPYTYVNGNLTPTRIRALPSYVLLVGIGLCAVVLKVLIRRTLGAASRTVGGGVRR